MALVWWQLLAAWSHGGEASWLCNQSALRETALFKLETEHLPCHLPKAPPVNTVVLGVSFSVHNEGAFYKWENSWKGLGEVEG